MIQCRRETTADRWLGTLERGDDEAAPGRGYRDFFSYFGIPVSEFLLTHRDELIDEVSDVRRKAAKRLVRFTHHYYLYGVQSYYTASHMTITRSLSL